MAQRVSFEERCRIEALAGEGSWSVAEIAVHVGRSEPTIRREFARCGGRGFYASGSAQADADRKAMRPKVPKLVSDPGLAREVTELLEWRWSPHAIGAYLREESPNRRVSAETIYQACYDRLASRGLRSGSWKLLPRRRPRRRSRSRCEQARRNQLGDIRGVRERPGGLTDRLPGHSVRRPHKRRPQPLGGRHPRRTVKPIHPPGRRRGQHRRYGDTGGNRSPGSSAAPPGAVAHLGPRTRNGRLAKNPGRDQSACVLLRPPLSLATTHQRTHQRHAPQMATQKHQSQHRPNPPLSHREPHQPHAQTTPPMARPTHPLPSTNQRPPLELARLGGTIDPASCSRFPPTNLTFPILSLQNRRRERGRFRPNADSNG